MRNRARLAVVLAMVLGAGPLFASSGLDVRPANPTCVAHARPVGSELVITTQRMFPYLTLSTGSEWTLESLAASPMVLRQSSTEPGIWYLAERSGLVHRINDVAQTTSAFLDIRSSVSADFLDQNEEGGLIGLALHPDFAANGEVYVFYTAALPGSPIVSIVSRFHSLDGGASVDPGTETVLLSMPQVSIHHHAGTLEFGADGMLYVAVGDGGSSFLAQDPYSLLGGILRIDVDQGAQYAIPPDNPYASGGGAGEVWAKGLRNPYRFSFDPPTGELWVGDVGETSFEEVNRVVPGENYGWPIREGSACHDVCCTFPALPQCAGGNLVDPIYEYPHSDTACNAVLGGYVYRGAEFPELEGRYVFGDWCAADVRVLFADPGLPAYATTIASIGGLYRSWARDESGELYVLRTREVHKLVRSTAPPPAPFPQHLSETGCVQPADPTQAVPGAIPFAVNAALWSDGAAKSRWLALPDGTAIAILPDGDWDLPIGTVLMKRFEIGGQPIETRLLMRHEDGGWAGYSYEWNDEGTDAELLETGKTKSIGAQTWLYPSRAQCFSCHTEVAGFSLGPTTAQLNGDFFYPATGRSGNQVETLRHVGLLGAAPNYNQRITVAPTESLDVRARSYLQANCAHCHSPGSPVQASIDFRFGTSLAGTHLCGVVPTRGDLGVPNARLVTAGDSSLSIVSLRMHDLGAHRMPPLATSIVDPAGTALIDAWITSLAANPDGSCVPPVNAPCADDSDNDGDGLVDFPNDPGCQSAASPRENPACNDAIDNDADGKVDFDGGALANQGTPIGVPDPTCLSTAHRTKEAASGGCGLGGELVLAYAALRRRRATRVSSANAQSEPRR